MIPEEYQFSRNRGGAGNRMNGFIGAKIKSFAWFALLALMLKPGIALGLRIHAGSWTVSSADNRYVFVMVSPLPLEKDQKYCWDKEKKQQYIESQRNHATPERIAALEKRPTKEDITDLRAKYRASGLYLNDGSTNVLWTLEGQGYLNSSMIVVVPSDGKHLVVLRDDGEGVSGGVLSFYDQGKLVRIYSCGDLVTFPSRLRWEPGPTRPWRESHSLDEAQGRLTVTTKLDDRFVFDLATGNIVSSRRYSLERAVVFGVVLAVIICIASLLAARFWFKSVQARKRRAMQNPEKQTG